MYLNFFNLTNAPFHITPDPEYLFLSNRHKESLGAIIYGIEERKGFICITGDVGTGKTTVIRSALQKISLRSKVVPINIYSPDLSFNDLLRFICIELGDPVPQNPVANSNFSLINFFETLLLTRYREGKNVVLIVDDAQNISSETLENMRLLTNLETNKDKLLQILLVGQPELEVMLGRPELRQIQQRIVLMVRLLPLSIQECKAYIKHRLSLSGADQATVFTPEAIDLIAKGSLGIPRIVNILCDNTLIAAYASQVRPITRALAAETLKEFSGLRTPEAAPFLDKVVPVYKSRSRWLIGAAAGFAVLFFILFGWMFGQLAPLQESSQLLPATFYRVFHFFSTTPDPPETISPQREEIPGEEAPRTESMHPQPVELPRQPATPLSSPSPDTARREPPGDDILAAHNTEAGQDHLSLPLSKPEEKAVPEPEVAPSEDTIPDLAAPATPNKHTAQTEATEPGAKPDIEKGAATSEAEIATHSQSGTEDKAAPEPEAAPSEDTVPDLAAPATPNEHTAQAEATEPGAKPDIDEGAATSEAEIATHSQSETEASLRGDLASNSPSLSALSTASTHAASRHVEPTSTEETFDNAGLPQVIEQHAQHSSQANRTPLGSNPANSHPAAITSESKHPATAGNPASATSHSKTPDSTSRHAANSKTEQRSYRIEWGPGSSSQGTSPSAPAAPGSLAAPGSDAAKSSPSIPTQSRTSAPGAQDEALAVWGGKVEKAAVAPLAPAEVKNHNSTVPSATEANSSDTPPAQVAPNKPTSNQYDKFPALFQP